MKKILSVLSTVAIALSLVLFSACASTSFKDGGGAVGGQITTPDGGKTPGDNDDGMEITAMYVYVNGNKLEVALASNSSVDALVALLKEGDITYTANDYGGFEKVGAIGHNLPQNNTQINTQAGDVILYQGNQICLYYGNNSWNFTRIGKINGYTASQIGTLLGAGNGSVQVTLSLK